MFYVLIYIKIKNISITIYIFIIFSVLFTILFIYVSIQPIMSQQNTTIHLHKYARDYLKYHASSVFIDY